MSFQRHGSELMFCNDSRMDEGDLARPGLATIAGRTSLEVFLVPAHDCGRHRRLIWAHQLPPIPEVIHTLDGRKNMKRFVHFRTNAHI